MKEGQGAEPLAKDSASADVRDGSRAVVAFPAGATPLGVVTGHLPRRLSADAHTPHMDSASRIVPLLDLPIGVDELRTEAAGEGFRFMAEQDGIGRLRHLYVRNSERRSGIGSALVQQLLNHAEGVFHSVRLRTDTREAATFYVSLKFRPVRDKAATHAKSSRQP